MIAWIIGIILLLVISLFITDQNVEGFEYNPPTVIPSKVRKDLTCSDPNESATFDRFDNAKLDSLGSALNIPPSSRFNDLGMNLTTRIIYGSQTDDTAKDEYIQKCIGSTDINDPEYMNKRGEKVFIDTGQPALQNNGNTFLDNGKPYNLVDLYCCKGEMVPRVGIFGQENKVCLPPCPSNYTKSSQDPTICIRNDSNCVYTHDLSANIQNNWFKTCAALYKTNVNLISAIQSISTVVSTFTIQSDTVKNNYESLNYELSRYNPTNPTSETAFKITHRNSNLSNITNNYNDLSNIQSNISYRYNTLKQDKLRFDTLFNNLGCSNYM